MNFNKFELDFRNEAIDIRAKITALFASDISDVHFTSNYASRFVFDGFSSSKHMVTELNYYLTRVRW
jgi:hypothetical protein